MAKSIRYIYRYILPGIVLILLFLAFLFIPQNPYLSNYLKRLLLPEIQSAIGYPVIAEKIYLHLFPFYAGIKDLRIMDEEGEKVLMIEQIKVYPEVSSLLVGRPVLKRISIKKPSLNMTEERFRFIRGNLESYLRGPKKVHLIVDTIEVSEGDLLWQSPEYNLYINQLSLHLRIRDEIDLRVSGKEVISSLFRAPFSFRARLTGRSEIDIKDISLSSGDSEIQLSGRLHPEEESKFDMKAYISMKDAIDLLQLPSPQDRGRIKAKGVIYMKPFRGHSGEVTVDTQTLLASLVLRLELSGEMRLENLMGIFRGSQGEDLSGDLLFNASLSGSFLRPELKGKGVLRKGRLFGVEVDLLKTALDYKDSRLRFYDAVAELYSGRAFASLEMPIPVSDFRLYVKAEDVRDKPVLRLIGVDLQMPDGLLRGELVHSGRIFSPSGWFLYKAHQAFSGEVVPSLSHPLSSIKEVSGRFLYDGEEGIFKMESLEISSAHGRLSGGFTYRVSDRFIDGTFSAGLDPSVGHSLFNFKTGELTGEVKGILPGPVLKARIRIDSPSIKAYQLQTLKGVISYSPELLNFTLEGLGPQEDHRITGRIRFPGSREIFDFSRPEMDIKAGIKGMRLRSLISYRPSRFFPDSQWRSNSDPRFDGEVSLKGDEENQKILLKLRNGRSYLEGDVLLKRWKEYSYRLHSSFIPEELQIVSPEVLQTSLRFDARGEGRFPVLKGIIHLRSDMVKLYGRPVGGISLDGVLEDDRISVAGAVFDGLINLRGEALLKGLKNYSLELKFMEGSYKRLLQAFVKDPPEDLDLSARGIMRITGEGSHLSGDLTFEKFILKGYGHELKNDGPVELGMERNLISIRSLRMINRGGGVTASGRLMIGQWYDVSLSGRTYLWPFKRVSRSITRIDGKTDFEINIGGSWDSPRLKGVLFLKDGTMAIQDIPYHLTDVDCVVRFRDNRIEIESLKAKAAGGTISARGVAYLRGFRLGRFNIEVAMDKISATVSEDFTMNLDGRLYLKGERYLNLITGEVMVRKAFYRRYIEWRTWILKFKNETPALTVTSPLGTVTSPLNQGEVPSYLDARLNVKISGPLSEPSSIIMIDNNIANATLKLDLLLKGTLRRPVLLGRVESTGGVVYFRNNELRLISATADFTTPERIDPYLRIRAETSTGGYRITLLLEGYLKRFNLSLASDPPLDEVDIIALLAVGKTGTALKGYGGGIGAAEASAFITGQLQDTLQQRARLYTGIDRIEFSPYVSKTGEIGPRVTVGKKIGERLSILYSTQVGSEESDVIKVEYELSRQISLVGEKDERGSIGGDIRFRFQFR